MLNTLRKPWVIFASFIIAVGLAYAFQVWIPSVGGASLDRAASVDDQMALLASMSDAQKNSHFRMTLMLDILFPLSFGAFSAGLALKFPKRLGVVLAVPAFLFVGFDYVENVTQLVALKGNYQFLAIKAFVTPTKFFLFNVAALIAVASLIFLAVKAVMSRLKNRAAQ